MHRPKLFFAAALLLGTAARGDIRVITEHTDADADAKFVFKSVPPPSNNDAGTVAKFSIVAGTADPNSGELGVLHDSRLPREADDPAHNFFFNAGTDGGRIRLDFGGPIDIKQMNSYSWHPSTRAAQVYQLYASDGNATNFNAAPGNTLDPGKCGWHLLARVDTRPKDGNPGGQHAVSISADSGNIGSYRYLLFAIARTESADPFGNTFFSEIDVLDGTSHSNLATQKDAASEIVVTTGQYEISIDTSDTPDLTEWARKQLAPMAKEWYPKIVGLLPSPGYEAPTKVTILFSEDMRGVAATSGTRIRCAGTWFRRNLEGEAVGAVFHELVHVVQQYGRARRANPDATRPPGWLTEGIPDYLRWFIYEPQTKGAEITRRNISRARYDASYRITANFLNWATLKYAKDLAKSLNAAIREGKYSTELWKTLTGHSIEELGDEWKREMEAKVAAENS
jgi:hypothetical protein